VIQDVIYVDSLVADASNRTDQKRSCTTTLLKKQASFGACFFMPKTKKGMMPSYEKE